MVNFSKLAASAKKAVDKAGGPDAVKAKAQKALDDAGGKEGLKAKADDVRAVGVPGRGW